VSDVAMALSMTTLMISGPTTSHHLPVFSWKPYNTSHIGLPMQYNFDWMLTRPRLWYHCQLLTVTL